MTCPRSQVHPQDGLWSWFVCVCATLSAAIIPGFGFSFGVVLPQLMNYFQSGREKTAWIGSMSLSLMAMFGPVTGPLCERFGCRKVTIVGAFLCATSLLVSSFVNQLELLYFTHGILFGVGNSLVFTAVLLVTPKYFTKWRSLVISFVAGGLGAGVLMYGPGLSAVMENVGWKVAFRIMISLMVLVMLLSLTFDENTTSARETVNNENVESSHLEYESKNYKVDTSNAHQTVCPSNNKTEVKVAKRKRFKLIDCSVWRVPMYTIVTLTAFVAFLAEFNPQIHLIKYTEELGIEAEAASRLFIYLGISTFLARPFSGILCSIPCIKPQYVFQAALFINGFSTILLPLITTYPELIGYVILYGACDGVYISLLNVLILGSLEDERRAAGFGMELFLTAITTLIGPPIAGLIGDSYGSYKPAFYAGGGISIFSGCLMFLLLCFKNENVDNHEPRTEVKMTEDTKL